MKKLLILLVGISFTAASCTSILFGTPGTSGTKGVFRTGDGGQSYHASNAGEGEKTIDNLTVNALIFDPFDPRILYLGSPQGIYKSEDGGTVWKFILTGISVTDIIADSTSSGVLYAVGVSGNHGKVLKTTDGGTSWLDIFSEANADIPVTSINISPVNNKLLLAGLGSGEIIRSEDQGATWQAGENFGDRIVRLRFTSASTVLALTQRKGLYVSANQGQDWTHKTGSITSTSLFSAGAVVPSVSLFHDLAFARNQTQAIFLGTEQGLIKTTNGGDSWELVNLPAKTSARRILAVGINPGNPSNLFTTIGSTVFQSVNNGLTWETNKLDTGRPAKVIIVNPNVQNVIYLGMGE